MEYQKQIMSLNVYGQMQNLYARDALSQAYLFVCPDEKTNNLLSRCVAMLLLCKNGNACGACSDCIKVNAATHPDILVYPKENIFTVEDASAIYENVNIKAMYGNKKVYILENFDRATEQAQNKMLKIIEEPPKGVIFILTATAEQKILPTVMSRVQKKYVDRLLPSSLYELLGDYDVQTKNIALWFGEGYIGKTLKLASDNEFLENYNNIKNLLINLKKSDQIPYFSGFINKDKNIFIQSLKILTEIFNNILFINLGKNNLIKNQYIFDQYKMISTEYSVNACSKILSLINIANKKIEANVNLVTLADNLLLDILEVKYLCK